MQPETKTIKLSDIVFDEIIYPRSDHDPALVQRYAESIEEIEAAKKYIAVSPDMKLLDGKHRWLAYRKQSEGVDREITVLVYPVATPHEQLKLAAHLNSDHGWQLAAKDKEVVAKSLHAYGMSHEEIASSLSVSKEKVSGWLSRIVKEKKASDKKKAQDMWMACHTQEEIAEAVGIGRQTITDWIVGTEKTDGFAGLVLKNYSGKTDDFTPPIYNVWKKQTKSNSTSHFGNSESQWVDNLLYLYTDPADIVVDPFAGGGSTIDVCKKRGRRYWVADRKPIVEREHEIRQHDLISDNGDVVMPPVPRWKDTRLVYLDPPYWKQAEGQYSNDPTDLANMAIEEFNAALAGVINGFAKKLKNGEPKYIALIIQPTQWKAPERQFTDHVGDMLRAVKLPVDMRYSAPYQTEQYSPQCVEWAKENKKCLVLTREIVVWRIN